MKYIYSLFYFSIYSLFILFILITIFKKMNLVNEKNLLVRCFEYNKNDNSNAKLFTVFVIFVVFWAVIFQLQ